MHIATCS